MTCNELNSKLADLLIEPEKMSVLGNLEAESHLEACADCRQQLFELRGTMALLDSWEAPEPNPYFLTRLNARLNEERQAAPASWLEKLRARFVYGSRLTLQPVAAMAMTLALLIGGGAYLELNNLDQPQPVSQAAVVHDLQTLDNNAQLLDQLETLSNHND